LYRDIKTTEDARKLQDDLEQLQKWERDWLMEFHPKKCRAGTTTDPGHCLGAHQNGQEQWWISLLPQELAVCGLQGNWLSTG
jgi:hypothetical protein